MFVTVVRLRKHGRKLDAEVIRQPHAGITGELLIDTVTSTRTGRRTQYAMLVRGFDGLLPPLREITRIKVKGGAMLLVGIEEAEGREHKRFEDFRQAWWIRPLVTHPAPPPPRAQSAAAVPAESPAMQTGPTT